MSADRELLELAARAAGYEINFDEPVGDWYPHQYDERGEPCAWWNPLRDHDQAKLLRHELRLTTGFDDRWPPLGLCAYATYPTGATSCNSIMQNVAEAGGKKAALRRAIVLAAAEIELLRRATTQTESEKP